MIQNSATKYSPDAPRTSRDHSYIPALSLAEVSRLFSAAIDGLIDAEFTERSAGMSGDTTIA